MKLALVQTDIVLGNPEKNQENIIKQVKKAAVNKPDVIVLPEMWNTGLALEELESLADRFGKPSASMLGELAAKYSVNIVAGSVADLREGRLYNTCYVYDRNGKEVARYDKGHLFGLMKEDKCLHKGSERVTFILDGVKCGVMICYELRFPELARALALDGIELLFVPAQWPHPRLQHWQTLLRARAIENQFFVAAVNRAGVEKQVEFFGHSTVVGPEGNILIEGDEQEGTLCAEIDFSLVKRTRRYMNCFADRNPQMYG